MGNFQNPLGMVDVALFTLRDKALCLLLAHRVDEPYKGVLALPGGFIRVDEDLDAGEAASRVIRAKIGMDAPYVEQLYTFSGKLRDPRGWSISIAYYALVPEEAVASATAEGLVVVPVDKLPPLPFDHDKIVAMAVNRLRGKATYSSLPAFLLGDRFTLNELHQVYQQVIGARLDKASFRRKIMDQAMVEPIEGERGGGAHRPAQLYRRSQQILQEFKRTI